MRPLLSFYNESALSLALEFGVEREKCYLILRQLTSIYTLADQFYYSSSMRGHCPILQLCMKDSRASTTNRLQDKSQFRMIMRTSLILLPLLLACCYQDVQAGDLSLYSYLVCLPLSLFWFSGKLKHI